MEIIVSKSNDNWEKDTSFMSGVEFAANKCRHLTAEGQPQDFGRLERTLLVRTRAVVGDVVVAVGRLC